MHAAPLRPLAALFASFVLLHACGGDDGGKSKNDGLNDAATFDSGTAADAAEAGSPVVPFNGDCSSAKWADVTDECWSCLCEGCAAKLDACNEACVGILGCAVEKQTLVGVAADIQCEIAGTAVECLKDKASQDQAQALIAFDACLMGAPNKPAGKFRACEAECGVVYSGDVCQRYSSGGAGDGG